MQQVRFSYPITLTPAGRAALEYELRYLHGERLPEIVVRLAEAREDPAALDEDAGLLELQEEQHRLERRANHLERMLSSAGTFAQPMDGVAALGSHVEIEEGDECETYQLVDPCEADVIKGRLSVASPVGQALLGHHAGDVVAVVVPSGERRMHVSAVW